MEKFLNLIFIHECVFCKSIGSHFCKECLDKCKKLESTILFKPSGVKCIFGYEYEGTIRECIRSAKYKNKHFAALKVLSKNVCTLLESKLRSYVVQNCIVVPVPVSKSKLHKRGFNQAELISQIFSKSLQLKSYPNLLRRVKETSSQYTNNRKERFENMKDAFEVNSHVQVSGKIVLLVDDVCTTGATFIEAAHALKVSGAKEVVCVALARKSLLNSSRSHSRQV
jgi:competence protein ComFC